MNPQRLDSKVHTSHDACIQVSLISGSLTTIRTSLKSPLPHFKQKLAYILGIAPWRQRLLHQGGAEVTTSYNATLESEGIIDGAQLLLVVIEPPARHQDLANSRAAGAVAGSHINAVASEDAGGFGCFASWIAARGNLIELEAAMDAANEPESEKGGGSANIMKMFFSARGMDLSSGLAVVAYVPANQLHRVTCLDWIAALLLALGANTSDCGTTTMYGTDVSVWIPGQVLTGLGTSDAEQAVIAHSLEFLRRRGIIRDDDEEECFLAD